MRILQHTANFKMNGVKITKTLITLLKLKITIPFDKYMTCNTKFYFSVLEFDGIKCQNIS